MIEEDENRILMDSVEDYATNLRLNNKAINQIVGHRHVESYRHI